MVPKLNIDKLQSGLYQLHVQDHGVDLIEPDVFGRIAEALSFAGRSVPDDWALYVEVRYGGVCLGTRPLQQLAEKSEQVAQELVALMAEVMEAERLLAR